MPVRQGMATQIMRESTGPNYRLRIATRHGACSGHERRPHCVPGFLLSGEEMTDFLLLSRTSHSKVQSKISYLCNHLAQQVPVYCRSYSNKSDMIPCCKGWQDWLPPDPTLRQPRAMPSAKVQLSAGMPSLPSKQHYAISRRVSSHLTFGRLFSMTVAKLRC